MHVDAGWNSELAVKNIEQIIKKVKLDLVTHVVDWEDMRELQLAFLRSNLANQDVPQDHAYFAALYHYAVKNKIKYVISGSNYATESVLPQSWGYNAMDASTFGRFAGASERVSLNHTQLSASYGFASMVSSHQKDDSRCAFELSSLS